MSLVDLGKRLLELAKLGETEEVRQLMTNGAPFTTDWLGASPLHMAAQYGHVETAEVLLRAGISRDARTKVDRTPLHIAAQEGHLPLVELLLRHGADVESRDMLRMTSLHWAVERGHPGIIKCLLRHGADINASSKFEKTPVDIAADNRREDLVNLVQDYASIAEKNPIPKPVRPALVPGNNTTPIVLKAVPNRTNFMSTTSGTTTVDKKVLPAMAKVGKPIILQASMMGLPRVVEKATNNNTNDSDEGDGDSCSTSVLATLAALAEATAPNSAVSSTDALQWLETHGITMLPADNSTIVSSALEGGQTITLTEAGKLALNWVRDGQQNNANKVIDSQGRNQKVITIVTDQSHALNPSNIVVMSGSAAVQVANNGEEAKRAVATEEKTNEEQELKKKLEEVTRQAEEYKAQLQRTMNEAQEYKKQLERMLHEPSKSEGC